jgi:hypothetical protein
LRHRKKRKFSDYPIRLRHLHTRPDITFCKGRYIRIVNDDDDLKYDDRVIISVNIEHQILFLGRNELGENLFVHYDSPDIIGWYELYSDMKEQAAAILIQAVARGK